MTHKEIDFFIVGYPRSGTTLAASLLSRNPDIYISPETHFYRNFVVNNKNNLNKYSLINAFIDDKRLSDIGINKELLENFTPKKHKLSWLLNESLSIKAKEMSKNIIGEKTPAHMMFYTQILKDYPEAKFIVIIRDGRDCVFSNIKEEWTFSNPIKHAAEWNLYMDTYNKLIEEIPENVYTVRYEDLIENPSKYVKVMTEFVGGNYISKQIEDDTSKSVIPKWEKNWKEKASKAPDKTNKYKWKLHKDKQLISHLTYIMQDYLKCHEYDITPIEEISKLHKFNLYIRNIIYTPKIYPIMKFLASSPIYKRLKSFQTK